MRRPSPAIAISLTFALFCALFSGCSGMKNAGTVAVGTPSSVTVTPGATALTLGAMQRFTAKVNGSTDQTVQWLVNGVPRGNAASGLISEGGVYLAPTALPASSTVTVTAASFADPSQMGTAIVTLSQNPGVTVAINGSSVVTMAQTFGPPIPFTATVTGSANPNVTWMVNGVTGGSAQTGTIAASGVYNPPHSVPVSTAANNDGQTVDVIVTAVSVADTSASDSVDVVIVPPQQNAQTLPTKLGASGGNANDTAKISGQTFCCGGTLGAEVLREGQKYILSNNHVLARSDLGVAGSGNTGDAIVQPGLIDSNCSPSNANTVANLSQFYNLENASGTPADAAIALVVSNDVDASGTILQLGGTNNGSQPTDAPPHQGSGISARVGETIAKSGRSTGLTCASITATNIQTNVEYQKGCGTGSTFTVKYNDAISMGDGTFSAEGDSGSLVVDITSADAVGLLFGGSDTDTVANPIADVLAQMADSATAVRPTILGAANPHPVAACSLPGPQAAMAAALAMPRANVSEAALQQAEAARDAHLVELLALPDVRAVGIGSSYDNPQEAAVLLFVSKETVSISTPPNLPPEIDGVRTRILAAEIAQKRGPLSLADSAFAEQSAPAPVAVQTISDTETVRALTVLRAHAADWLTQASSPEEIPEALSKRAPQGAAESVPAAVSEGLPNGVQGVGITSSVDAPGEAALLIFLIRGQAHPVIPAVIDGLRTRVRVSSRFRAGNRAGYRAAYRAAYRAGYALTNRELRAPQAACGWPARLAAKELRTTDSATQALPAPQPLKPTHKP